MTSLIESIKKGPVMTMTLKCDTEFPKALKNIMESMGLKGEAVYKGFPVMDDGQEYWWVQLHLYKDEEDDPKKMEHWMFTNPELHTSFFDSARCVAWAAINELAERLKYRLQNTQKDLKEEKEETANLNTTVGRLRSDMVDLSLKLGIKDLVTCECTEAEKIRFTAHLLEGPAARWWETYQLTHPIDDLDWETFKEGFRTAHISSGIMNLKRDEFRGLRQGGRTLKEYMDDFCAMARYAPEDIDTDAKRREKFLNGTKGELKIPLSVAYAPSYQSLLDQAITLDNNINKEENRKRKFSKNHTEPFHKKHHSSEGSGSHNSPKHNGHFSKGNGDNYNGHKHNEGFKGDYSNSHPNGNNGRHNVGNGHQNGNNGQHRRNTGDLSHITCFKCKKTGHFADRCTEKKPDEVIKPNPFQKGQVNHLHVEEVVNEPNTVMAPPPRLQTPPIARRSCAGNCHLRPLLPAALARHWPRRHHQSDRRAPPHPVHAFAAAKPRRNHRPRHLPSCRAAHDDGQIVEEIKVVLVIVVIVRVALIKASDAQFLLIFIMH
ncbi:hypothetical protein QYE76_034617 [Lolium multiflorum]|uniref:CCHC-type domain-containing protein n=1 Tax=Lolium multiflorum TaxID=4521 RepID=A0AAD8QZY7_LOLMU|nr:hypothetical protein QYE76_034617 [Lolium multiflorum]